MSYKTNGNLIILDMRIYSSGLKRFLDSIPGKKRLGVYRFLPLFFGLGAALEFSMINWTVGETNFCKLYIEYKEHKLSNTFLFNIIC